MSKNVIYENPYIIIGNIIKAGLKKRPKDIMLKDREIGTWKARDVDWTYFLYETVVGKILEKWKKLLYNYI